MEIQVSEPDRNVDLERIIKAWKPCRRLKGEPESLSSSYPMLKLMDTLENSIHPLL